MDITDLVTIYGPLGFGWVAAIVLFRENKAIVKKYHAMSINSIKIKIELAQRLRELSEIIKKGFGDV
jgi:hypothetical protein